MPLPAYPVINRSLHDWSSIKLILDTQKIQGFKELSYKHGLDPGVVYGAGSQPIGHTQGVYSAEGSMSLLLADYNALVKRFGKGYLTKVFNIVVQYSPKKGDEIIEDQLIGCRMKTADKSFSQSNEGLLVKVDLFVMLLKENAEEPIPDMLGV